MTTTEAALDRMAGNLRKENIHMEATNVLAGIEHGEHQALLAPASGHGRFVVIMSSSVTGELARRSVRGRMPAFAEAVRMLRERAAAEASNNLAALHGEVITVAIESDDG
jgi:hypothetical protein